MSIVNLYRERFFVRTDCHGYYSGQGVEPLTAHKPVSNTILEDHIGGRQSIGAHSTHPESGWCKWLVLDIDAHKQADDGTNWANVLKVLTTLKNINIPCLVEDSNGKGGFHLWIFWNQPVHCSQVRAFGLWLSQGFDCEVFPKSFTPKPYGNFVRVPAKHHTRDHWSAFWDGEGWIPWQEAQGYILDFPKADFALVPDAAKLFRPPVPQKPANASSCVSGASWRDYTGDLTTLDLPKLWDAKGQSYSDTGTNYKVLCPWRSEHTTGDEAFVWNEQGKYPSFYCHHSHCSGRTTQEYLAAIATPPEIDDCCAKAYVNKGIAENEGILIERNKVTIEQLESDKLEDVNKPKKRAVMDGSEIDKQADAETSVFIVEDWLETASVNMIHGKSISGKTYILTHGVGAILEGGLFLEKQCLSTPVLYLNCDMNRIKRIRNNIKAGMKSEDKDRIFNNLMYMTRNECLPTTLTAKHLEAYVKDIHEMMVEKGLKPQPVLIIVDTFRSAFMMEAEKGTENDAVIMKFIKPIRQWCIDSGNAVFLVHHNNKHADDYVGSGAFLMLLDSKWNYRRTEEDVTGVMSINTRNDYYVKFNIGLDAERKPTVVAGKVSNAGKAAQVALELENVALCFGAIGKSRASAYADYCVVHKSKISQKTFDRRVEDCIEGKLLTLFEPAAGQKPAVFKQFS